MEGEKIKNTNFNMDKENFRTFDKSLHYIIADHSEKKKYKRSADLKNTHWGQLKLFISELLFLTNYYDQSEVSDVIYIGAAPGDHIPILSKLFPSITFHLYDKSEFRPQVYGNDKIKIYNKYFDIMDIEEWKEKPCILISDIRTVTYDSKKTKVSDMKKNEVIVWNDMNLQRKWVEEIKPIYSLLKFRLPYAEKFELEKGRTRKYLDGIVYIQPFCKPSSSESRLCVLGKQITERDWDILEYEQKLFFHNSERRCKHSFENPIHKDEMYVYPELGLFNDYDSIHFTHTVADYMKKIGRKPNHQNVKKLLKYIIENITGENMLLKFRDC